MTESPPGIGWSRLVAEGAVIVVSILLAFAVDAWWDSRQERAREDAYLRELVVDLEGTFANNAAFSQRAESIDWAAARLVQSYYEATPPQPDSVAYWLSLLGCRDEVAVPRRVRERVERRTGRCSSRARS